MFFLLFFLLLPSHLFSFHSIIVLPGLNFRLFRVGICIFLLHCGKIQAQGRLNKTKNNQDQYMTAIINYQHTWNGHLKGKRLDSHINCNQKCKRNFPWRGWEMTEHWLQAVYSVHIYSCFFYFEQQTGASVLLVLWKLRLQISQTQLCFPIDLPETP